MTRTLLALFATILAAVVLHGQVGPGLRFEVTLDPSLPAQPSGRLLVVMASSDRVEPRRLIGRTGRTATPTVGVDVPALAPGDRVILAATAAALVGLWCAAARAAERALPLLKPGYGLRFASLPTGEDPDSLIECHGRKAMSKTIAEAVPLSEVLWRMETGGRLPKTPEAKATLQQRLKDYARTIQDPTVRSHFANSFNDRIWPRNRYRSSGAATWSPNMHLDAKAGPAAHIATQERREQIIIAVILNHPCLYDEIGERLGTVDFSTPKLDKLRQEVLKALAGNSVLESGDLKNHLNCCGLSDVLDVVLSAEVYSHAYFARPETAPEEARQGWEETFGQLMGKNLLTEIREAERNFAEAPTKEASQRLLILKRQQMDEAVGGQRFESDKARIRVT